MKNRHLIRFVIFGIIAFTYVCDKSINQEDDNMPQNGKYIEVIVPKGEEIYRVGEKVTISCRIDAGQISSLLPRISINHGATWDNISEKQITVDQTSGGKLVTHEWIIGGESETVQYTDTLVGCKIRFEKYNNPDIFDTSGVFTVITPQPGDSQNQRLLLLVPYQ